MYKELLKYADKNNGRVITQEITYLKKCKSIKFECKKGHRWEVVTHKALTSTWCPECNGTKNQRNTIELMKEIAINRGGCCLSEKYINAETKLEWQCSEGHKWLATPHSVKSKNSWCRKCNANKLKNTIEDMQKLAEKKGGKCLSTQYILNNVNLKWQCSEGHTWENQPANITMGQWCPVCSKEKEKLTIEEMKELAKQKGGLCLSMEYIDLGTKLHWQCRDGHYWWAVPRNVKHNGAWCPICAGNTKKTLTQLNEVANSFGGKLLSTKYSNSKQKLKWQCSEGHIFFRSLSHVVHRDQWCSICKMASKVKQCA